MRNASLHTSPDSPLSYVIGTLLAPTVLCAAIVHGAWISYRLYNAKQGRLCMPFHNSRLLQDLILTLLIAGWQAKAYLLRSVCSGLAAAQKGGLLHVSIVAPSIVLSGIYLAASRPRQWKSDGKNGKDHGPLRPLLLPCRTTHARIFPKKHSFGYSYLFVGVPVGWKGSCGDVLTVGTDGQRDGRGCWLSVCSADYLERGGTGGLESKLDGYLQTQGIERTQWSHAYLVTAPRFFGYSFNPVSFWYIYKEQLELIFMVLEVNNTFDERRMYLLRSEDNDTTDTSDPSVSKVETPKRFVDSWAKDFHVSPFNSRKGSYHLSAIDPLIHGSNDGLGKINNTITLKSSKNHSKLVARIFSTSDPIDPATLTTFQKWWFMLSWWWVGLATYPRILKEAAKLFFQRKLHVWFRPEVQASSIGRVSTATERYLAGIITQYLHHLARQSSSKICLTLHPGIPNLSPRTTHAPDCPCLLSPSLRHCTNPITITITTPAFYISVLVHMTTASSLRSALLPSNPSNQLGIIHPSTPQAIEQLTSSLSHTLRPPLTAPTVPSSQSSTSISSHVPDPLDVDGTSPQSQVASRSPLSLLTVLRWSLLALLRPQEPPVSAHAESSPAHSGGSTTSRPDGDPGREPELDAYVREELPRQERERYRRAATKSIVAARVTLGSEGIVGMVDVGIRAVLILIAHRSLQEKGGGIWLVAMKAGLIHVWEMLKG